MREDFQEVRAILESYGIDLKRISTDFYERPQKRGAYYFVHSPSGTDKTASLCLYPNRFVDYSNSNKAGDAIGFVAYIRGISNWEALKIIKTTYGIQVDREVAKEEMHTRIQRQQAEKRLEEERKQAFYMALCGEIERLKRWAVIYSNVIEKTVFEPFSESFVYCVGELQKVNYRLDILTTVDMNTYRRMKYSDVLASDRPQWLLDVLMILSECGVFQATEDEISEIKAQRDFELTRAAGEQRRCKIDW